MFFLLTTTLFEALGSHAGASVRDAAPRWSARQSRPAFWTLPLLLSAAIATLCFYAALNGV